MKKLYLLIYPILFSVTSIYSGNHKFRDKHDIKFLKKASVFFSTIDVQPIDIDICNWGNGIFSVSAPNTISF